MAGSDCDAPKITYFSNPDVYYDGVPTGTAEEDCARMIEDNKVRLAVDRRNAVALYPPISTAGGEIHNSYVPCRRNNL